MGAVSRSTADISTAAIAHNVAQLQAAAPAAAALCAVVKADGYGHGAEIVGRAALAAGASWLAVAHAAEGAALREAGIDAPILLLSEPVDDAEVDLIVANDLRATVYSDAAIDALAARRHRLPVHLKVDTGMRRVGARPDELVALAARIGRATALELEGLCTHCAVADEPDNAFTELQLARFADAHAMLLRQGIEVPLRHAANSATVLTHPHGCFELIRPGIALYGVAPAPALEGRLDLRPALRWHSAVSHVKRVAAGEGVSYGHHHRTGADTLVATVPVGYADGLPRRWALTGGAVLIGGRRRPVLGVITMDQLLVDCGSGEPDGSEVARGDEVVLIGGQGGARVTADEIASATGTIAYEILTGIGPRVARQAC